MPLSGKIGTYRVCSSLVAELSQTRDLAKQKCKSCFGMEPNDATPVWACEHLEVCMPAPNYRKLSVHGFTALSIMLALCTSSAFASDMSKRDLVDKNSAKNSNVADAEKLNGDLPANKDNAKNSKASAKEAATANADATNSFIKDKESAQ